MIALLQLPAADERLHVEAGRLLMTGSVFTGNLSWVEHEQSYKEFVISPDDCAAFKTCTF